MTLFPPEAAQDAGLGTMTNATYGLGVQLAIPPIGGPATPLPGDPVQLLVRRLLPSRREAEAAHYAQQLTDRVAARVAALRSDIIQTRLRGTAPAVLLRLEDDSTDLDTLLLTLTRGLDVASALFLLDDPALFPDADRLLSDAAPDLREAALDAMTPGRAASRFDQLCQNACMGQIKAAIGRLPIAAMERQTLRRQLMEEDPPRRSRSDAGEPAFLEAVRRGDHPGAVLALSAAALVPAELVEAAIALRNRRGLISLAWKAGFSMQSAILLQSQLAGVAPDAVLGAMADGGCPLGRSEMVWQIGLLSRMLP
jgi:hypothetical protein